MNKKIILIVDDNPANIPHVVDYLEFHGFVTHVASDGEGGVEKETKDRDGGQSIPTETPQINQDFGVGKMTMNV